MPGLGKVEITLHNDASEGTFPQGVFKLDASQDLDQQLGPPGSGGLLAALHLWRQLLIEGPAKFGNVTYYGTGPSPAVGGQADILLATRNVADMQLAFDPKTGQLAGVEVVADATDDGCVLHFSDYRDVGGRSLPHTIEIRRGDELFGQIQWRQIELSSSSEDKKP